MPYKQPKRRRLWFNDGLCVRLRVSHKDHVWSYDFVMTRTHDGRPVRILAILDEFTRECLAIEVERRMNHKIVLEMLAELFVHRGTPLYIRSDNGSEFVAQDLRDRLDKVGVNTAYIEPGSPWDNGYIESFNARLRDELLNGEIFDTLLEAKVLIERWRVHYNQVRPHSALNGRPPAPETLLHRKDFSYMNLMVPTPYLDPLKMLGVWYSVQFAMEDRTDEEESFYARANGVYASPGGVGGACSRSV